jgi:arsenical pump membrane protein
MSLARGAVAPAPLYRREWIMMDAVKLVAVGVGLLALGGIAVVTGVLPVSDVGAIGERVWPVLLFVVAVTVVAELAAVAGVFDVAGGMLARWARGRTFLLWLMVVLLAIVSTAFLSLDTTAVLLTPVVVAVARANGLPPLPFAFATVWLANTASLVLPVSNLTNLLAVHRLDGMSAVEFDGMSAVEFVGLLGPSALLAIAVSSVLLWCIHRRARRGRFVAQAAPRIVDRVQLRVAAAVVVVLLPLLVSGVEPWIPSSAAAVILAVFFAWRSPGVLSLRLIPWSLVVFACGLFLVVGAVEALGSRAAILALTGSGSDLIALWQLSGAGAASANAINNLPAYLALEQAADTPARLAALLIGVNAGPLITPWASLATLLWHQRLASVGVDVRWRVYVMWGLVAAPLTVLVAVIPLAI